MLDLPLIAGAVAVTAGLGVLVRTLRRARARRAAQGVEPLVRLLDERLRHLGRARPVRQDLEEAVSIALDAAEALGGAATAAIREQARVARRALEVGDPDTARELLERVRAALRGESAR